MCSWEAARPGGCLQIFGSDGSVVRNVVPRVRPPVCFVRKSRLSISLDALGTRLVEELALRPGRFRTSLRWTTISTISVGLMASEPINEQPLQIYDWPLLFSSV